MHNSRSGSEPIILHMQGKWRARWWRIRTWRTRRRSRDVWAAQLNSDETAAMIVTLRREFKKGRLG